MAEFTREDICKAAHLIADHLEKVEEELNSADGKLGDGDLGITVSRGWRAIADDSDTFPADIGLAFLECAKAFQRVSPSSFGTLMATAFMSAAKSCKGKQAIAWDATAGLLHDACSAMISRGKGQLGDKTVLDIFHAMALAAEGRQQPDKLLTAICQAIDRTLAEFKGKENKIGRARMFGKNSIGLDDPGMLAIREMIEPLQ